MKLWMPHGKFFSVVYGCPQDKNLGSEHLLTYGKEFSFGPQEQRKILFRRLAHFFRRLANVPNFFRQNTLILTYGKVFSIGLAVFSVGSAVFSIGLAVFSVG